MKRNLSQDDFMNLYFSDGIILKTFPGKTLFEKTQNPNRVFECKTCNRTFPSFQALGGHRASHKKPKTTSRSPLPALEEIIPAKPKSHECSICGLEFAVGQALGGHMRRHRSENNNNNNSNNTRIGKSSIKKFDRVGKRSENRRSLFLDLNLTPLENDLETMKLQSVAKMVENYIL